MAKLRTHYENLQVARGASAEVIRAAYRALSQKWHPDKHPRNRREAERVMQIINHAYEVLSDPVKRREHDRWIARVEAGGARAAAEPSPAREGARPSPARAGLERVVGGYFRYRSLPEATRRRLGERVAGRAGAGATARIGGVARNYAWIALLAGGLWGLDRLVASGGWPQERQELSVAVLLAVALAVALAIAANATKVLRWHLSPLGCRLVATPLHVVGVRFDEVWARPMWTLSDLEVSRKGGRASKTRLRLVFTDAREAVTIDDREQAEVFLAALQGFRARTREALAAEDWRYFVAEDDFAGAEPRPTGPLRRALPSGTALLVYPLVLGLVAGVFLDRVPASSSAALEKRLGLTGIERLVPPALEAAVASLTLRAQPLPANGRERRYHRSVSLAPFEIRAHVGSGHYFVKVTDWSSGETVMTVFVREGQTVETTLPTGSYRIEYANGPIWYGEEHLFGPRTELGRSERRLDVYETAEGYAGFTVEFLPRDREGARPARVAPDAR